MKITPVSSYNIRYLGSKINSDKDYENPISKTGEKAKLIKATFAGGLLLGSKLLLELMDGDFLFDILGKKAVNITKKTSPKNISNTHKFLRFTGAMAGLLGMFIGGFALIYTLFKAPKINYEGNVNAYTHKKDMDVYIEGNKAEKEILTQMNEKAKTSNQQEKAKLQSQYLQMQMVKNRPPQFIKLT